jgi:peptide/nickel transport system substrate-binding protein
MLLTMTIFVVLSLLLSGCLPISEEQTNLEEPETMTPEIEVTEVQKPLSYQQAPMLDDMDLPPVEERLPEQLN